ncbi:hypothetical protein AGLY_005149, partial [Aphis glycines]
QLILDLLEALLITISLNPIRAKQGFQIPSRKNCKLGFFDAFKNIFVVSSSSISCNTLIKVCRTKLTINLFRLPHEWLRNICAKNDAIIVNIYNKYTSAVNKIQKMFFLVSVFMRYFFAMSSSFLSYISFFCRLILLEFYYICSNVGLSFLRLNPIVFKIVRIRSICFSSNLITYRQHNSSTILSNSLSSTFILLLSIRVFKLVAKFCKKNAPKIFTCLLMLCILVSANLFNSPLTCCLRRLSCSDSSLSFFLKCGGFVSLLLSDKSSSLGSLSENVSFSSS